MSCEMCADGLAICGYGHHPPHDPATQSRPCPRCTDTKHDNCDFCKSTYGAPVAPSPPTENARAGAEFEYPTGNASIDAAYTAGRARGIAEERKRAVKIARDVSARADAAMIERRRHGFRVDNYQERDTADAIAAAIAKETGT